MNSEPTHYMILTYNPGSRMPWVSVSRIGHPPEYIAAHITKVHFPGIDPAGAA